MEEKKVRFYRRKTDVITKSKKTGSILLTSRFNVLIDSLLEYKGDAYEEVEPEDVEILNTLEHARKVTLSELARKGLREKKKVTQDEVIKHYDEIAKIFNL